MSSAAEAAAGAPKKVVDLKIAPVDHEAAKFAVMRWHYSQAMPSGKLICFGVWEDGAYKGVVIYGRGANKDLMKPYGLDQTEGCELVRVALSHDHKTFVTQIVAQTLKLLKRTNPGLRLVVSFADSTQGHHGGIYQAGNWIYSGESKNKEEYVVNGKRFHGRSLRALRAGHPAGGVQTKNTIEWAQKFLDPKAYTILSGIKYRYLYPLDRRTRAQVLKLAQPYPKKGAEHGNT